MRLTDLTWLLGGVTLNAAAQLALKSATRATGRIDGSGPALSLAIQQLAVTPTFWFALLAYGLSVGVWIVGLSRVPVSQAYPVLSLGYVLTAVAAWPLLGEPVSPQRWLGIAVVVSGVWLIARN
jgi:multidrug transporter EmrE-like cation transporter